MAAIGTPVRRREDYRFLTGQGTYTDDINRPGQAYAYILTHPGLPSVYWKHYFDWGPELQNKIRALINARKVAGVTSGSRFNS